MQKHLQKLLLLAVFLLVPWVTQAQSLDDYSFSTGVDTTKWINMSSATQILTPSGNDGLASSLQNIGFSFPFASSTYTQYSVNTDGNLRLGSTVASTSYYSTPFSASNANQNNPKINAFACDGYGVSGIHYVKALLTEDANYDSMLVVEFCTGTYNTTTRNELYKWQVHLYTDGDIEIVYGPAPAAAPNVARQPGLCVNSSDGWTIDANHRATHFTAGVATTTVALGTWPTEGRYYRFAKPNLDCPKPTAIAVSNMDTGSFDISWTDTSSATSWIVQLFEGDSTIYDNVEYYNSVSFTGLTPATFYTVQVAGLCANGDTSGFRTLEVLTSCALITSLPYTQDFDGVMGSTATGVAVNNLPPCWANHNTGTNTSYSGYPIVYNSSSTAHSGSQAMRFYTYITAGTYSDQIAIMPLTDSTVLPLSDMQVTFWMRSTSTSYNSHVIVGVMTDPTDASTFVPIEDVSTNSSTVYAQHTVVLSSYTGPHGYVAFKAPQPTSSYNALLIDDVTLEEPPSCLPVHNLTVTQVTGESISLAWSPIGNEADWIVSDGTNEYHVYDSVYTLTGLTANTAYTISVRAYCGGTDTSAAVTISARTSCGAATVLPIAENFDGVTGTTSTSVSVNNLPPCWNYINHGTRTSYTGYPIVYSSSTYAHSGSNCMRFYSFYTAADSNQYAILPLTDSTLYPVNNLVLTFQMRAYTTTSTYGAVAVVGVITNPTDDRTFVPIDTVNSNGITTYSSYEVYLANYTGPHGNVAILFPCAANVGFNYNYGYVDDIVLDVLPTCPPVQNITQTEATTTSVTVTWTEVGAATQWVLEYDTVDFVPGTGSGNIMYVTSLPYTLSGLDSGYSYYIYVHGDCGSGDTSSNVFLLANTLSGGGGLPYVCDFEGSGNDFWDLINGSQTNKWYVGTAVNNGGSRSLYISDNNGTSNSYDGTSASYVFAVKEFSLDVAGEYAYSYDWKCNGESSFDFMRAAMVPGTTVLTAGSYCGFDNTSAMPAGGMALDGGYRLNLQTSWQTQSGTILITTPGTYKWVFMWRNDGSVTNQPPIAIDNVMLQRNTCPAPTVHVDHFGIDSVIIAWHPNGEETSWEVISDSIQDIVYDTTYSFGDLQSNTVYHFAVRAICGDGDTSMPAGVSQRTLCTYLDTLPYTMGFESYEGVSTTSSTSHNFVNCWHLLNNGSQYYGYPYVSNSATYNHTPGGSMGLYWYAATTTGTYGDYQCIVLPGVDTDIYPINTLQLTFWAKASSTSYNPIFYVGVMTNPDDINTFTSYDTINVGGNTSFTEYITNFSGYTGSGNFIAVKAVRPSSVWYAYVDDFKLEVAPDCPRVEDITVSGITIEGATISWVDTSDAVSWIVQYGPRGFTPGDSTSTTEYVSDTSVTLTGLASNTEYEVIITVDCSEGVGGVNNTYFRTLCTYLDSLPFTENFDSQPTGSSTTGSTFANCWHHLNNGTSYGGYPYVGGSTYNHTPGGSKGLYWYNTTTTGTYGDYQIIVLPGVDTDSYPINTLQVSFWARPSSTSYNPTFEVGVMSDPTNPSAFVPVDTIHVGTSTTWTEFTVPLGGYTGFGQFVAVRATRSTASWYAYVDDFTLEQMPSCPDVTDIHVQATAGAARVTWDVQELPGVIPTGYNVSYGYAADSLVGATTLTTTDPYTTLLGLTPDTMYTISVSVDCGGFSGHGYTRNFTTRALPCLEWDTTSSGSGSGGSSPEATYVVGAPGTSSTNVMPVNGGFNYSYCNHIILASEVNSGAVYFSGIDFQYAGSTPMVNTTNCSIYMAHTTVTQCLAFEPVTDFQLVYEGPINCTTSGWNHFEFNRGSFAYDGTNNLVVAIVKNSGVQESGATFYYEQTPNSMSHRVYNNDSPYDWAAMAAATTTSNSFWRSNMRLTTGGNGGGAGCLTLASCAPPAVTTDSIVGSTVYLSWIPGYTETSWSVEYRAVGATTWTTATTSTSLTNYTLTGLLSNTQYEIRVGSSCTDTAFYGKVTVRTECGNTPVPFYETFDTWSSTAADPLPSCWGKHTNYSTNYPYASTSYNHNPGGSKAMYMYSTNATWSYMVLPTFAPPVDSLQLRFWLYKTNTSYAHRLIVGVLTDPDDETTFTPVATVVPTALSTWEEFTVPLNHYTGRGRHIAIMSPNGEYSYPYLDELTVEYIPDCMPVYNITASNITLTSADLTWTDSLATTQWTVEYGVTGFTMGTGTILTNYDTTISLTGLTANTSYTVYITPDCPAGIAGVAHFTFRTACGPIDSLPWFDNYDDYATGTSSTSSTFIPCYYHLNNGTSYGGYPYVGSSTSYNHTPGGSKGLYWYTTTTTGTYGDYVGMVLPEIDSTININGLQLSFWTKASSTSYTPVYHVGVMTDPTDITTFVGVDTVVVTSGTSWFFVEVPLTAYSGNGHYIAIKSDRPSSSWTAYLDDLTIEYAPTCIVPRQVFASNATTNSITVDWVDITPAIEWQIEYGLQGYTRGSSAGTLITTYSHPVTITGLDTLTTYDFYIRPVCTVGDTARWFYPTSLTTAMCGNSEICAIGSASSSGTTYFAPVNNYYRYTLSEVIIDSAEIGGPMDIEYIGYYYNYTTATTDKVNCTIYFQPTTKTAFTSNTDVVALNPATAVKVYEGHLNCSMGWNFFPLDTVYSYDGNGNLMIIVDDNSNDYNGSAYVFKSEPCSGYKTLYYYSDTYDPDVTTITSSYSGTKAYAQWRPVTQLVSCTGPACRQPVVTSIVKDYRSATVSWSGEGTNYEVNIKESAAANWPATDIAVTGNSYTFNGLMPATNYMFRIRQDCTADSAGYSEWVIDGVLTDSLPCLTPDSLHATAVTNATATLDWNVYGNETAWDIHVWYGSFDSTYRVTTRPATVGGFTAGLTYNAAIRPLCGVDLLEGDWSDTVQFSTATCPDVTGLATSNVTTNSVTLNWNANPMAQSYMIEYGYAGFTQGSGTQAVSSTNSYVATGLLDGVTFDFYVKAVCGDDWSSENWAGVSATTQEGTIPCDAPTGVNTAVADNSVTVNWTPNTGNISFEIEYGPHGFSHGTGVTTNATSSPAVINNLEYETQYDLYVRAICEQNTYSPWSTMSTFTTGERPSEDCDPVQNLNVDNVTDHNAEISWQPGPTGDRWQVVLTDDNGATVSDNVTTETHATLSGLDICKNYSVKVRTVCGDDNYSAYVTANFRTEGDCEGIEDVDGISCRIFPNPATSSTTISVSGVNGKVRIAVVDMNGRTVATETLECSSDCEKTMDVDKLAQGAYFVRITADNANMVRKLIVR